VGIVENPFLSELDSDCPLGRFLQKLPLAGRLIKRKNPALWVLAIFFPAMGAVAAWLSIRAHAAVRDVKLAPLRAGIPEITLHVGYLYELNAALFYLTASWIWVLAYLWFLRQTDTAVRALARNGRLAAPGSSVEQAIRRLNARWFSTWLMPVILVISISIIVGTEFKPFGTKGDYWRLAFGYVQASSMPAYRHDVSLKDLGREVSNKEVKRIGLDAYRIGEVKNAPGPSDTTTFRWFLFFAVAMETLFAPLAAWSVIKVAFVLRLLGRAFRNPNYPLRLNVVHNDCEKQFGLADLNRVYRAVAYLVYVSMAAEISSVISNVDKGSGRSIELSFSEQLAVLFGQSFVSYVPLILLGCLFVHAAAFSLRLRSLHAPLLVKARETLVDDDRRELILGQRMVVVEVSKQFARVGILVYRCAPLLTRFRWDKVSPYYEKWRHAADKVHAYFSMIL
jgi:hypothetical protein